MLSVRRVVLFVRHYGCTLMVSSMVSTRVSTVDSTNNMIYTNYHVSSTLEKKIDALDNWCLRRILHIHWTDFVSMHSPMMWFGHVRDNDSCQILSVNGACPSLVICAVPTSIRTQDHGSGPLPSSPSLHSGSSQRMATKNWKTEADLAENG